MSSVAAGVRLNGSGCRVADGIWHGPYTGERFTDPGDLHIDHIVPRGVGGSDNRPSGGAARKGRTAGRLKPNVSDRLLNLESMFGVR